MRSIPIFTVFCLMLPCAHSQTVGAGNSTGSSYVDPPSLPDAPHPASANDQPSVTHGSASDQSPALPAQTNRILGIIPNFRAVSADTKVPKQTVKEKFKTGLEDTFDYSNFVFIGLESAANQATDAYPAFHQGAPGYARYYWHTFADQGDENLLVESILPSVLHQDSRYYTLGRGGALRRAGYALSRAAITRTDSGSESINISEIVGAGAAAGISSAYYPEQYRTWTKTGQRWLSSIVLDTVTFAVKEFWPDINRTVFRSRN